MTLNTGVLSATTKKSDAAAAFLLGQDPEEEHKRHPDHGQAGRRNLGLAGNGRMILLDMRG